MRAYYGDDFELPLPAGHRFPMAKYRLLRERLRSELPALRLIEAPSVGRHTLTLAHDPAYVDAMFEGRLTAGAQRDIGLPWSAALVERACRSVGATMAAARAALQDGVAGNLAGGTHHAGAGRGSGYCVFNDVAVATRVLCRTRHAVPAAPRVAVIDLDVHQGDGGRDLGEMVGLQVATFREALRNADTWAAGDLP